MLNLFELLGSKKSELGSFFKVSSLGAVVAYGGAGAILFAIPMGMLILYTCFFTTFILTKLIYLVVPRTLENRWTVNKWLTVAWFFPFYYLWTAVATVSLTFLCYPMYAGVNIMLGNYDNINLILNAYGPMIEAYTMREITLEQLTWQFFVFDSTSPMIMVVRAVLAIAGFLYLYHWGAYSPGKDAFIEEETNGEHVALTFEF